MNRRFSVIAGPYRTARKYAESMGWSDGEFIIITRAHQLAQLDPALIRSIFTVKLHALGDRIMEEIHDEINNISVLWPVPTMQAA